MNGFEGWEAVSRSLIKMAQNDKSSWLNDGQRASVQAVAERIPNNGVIIADEVGMGKTRIAVALARCVQQCGGRTAILIPPGLGYQWRAELKDGSVETPELVRSLWGYLKAWSDDEKYSPWFNEHVVIISHAFTNWRLSCNSQVWRLALVPELIACWRKTISGKWPNGYLSCEDLDDMWVHNAAANIVDYCLNFDPIAKATLNYLSNSISWNIDFLLDGDEYSKEGELRIFLEKAVGIGLGSFDLVIIDEAHKSRGSETGLSGILNNILLKKKNCRRFAMTATPVELSVDQWAPMLERIGLNDTKIETIKKPIESYMESVADLKRNWRSEPSYISVFAEKAKIYQNVLSPFLLRRGKREESSVIRFKEIKRNNDDDYRLKKEIVIEPCDLNNGWKEAIFAAEALSVVTRQAQDPVAKRLRLTIGNGHGISALLDEPLKDPVADSLYEEQEKKASTLPSQEERRLERAEWWKKRLIELLNDSGDLYTHPAILKATEVIEKAVESGEKVLVFGRFTKPLQALTQLLNARAMLKCIVNGGNWPQSKIHDEKDSQDGQSEWAAVRAAHSQLNLKIELESIDQLLQEQYQKLKNQRARFRNKLSRVLSEEDMHSIPTNEKPISTITIDIAAKVRSNSESIAPIAQGLAENFGPEIYQSSVVDIINAFDDLVHDMLDEDDFIIKKENDNSNAGVHPWDKFFNRITDEFGRQQGRFARLMNGPTPMSTRRTIQSAFNREQSSTKVLVAQSIVGREGLNLHHACRTVLLLHPEWNPGVVEQQIGRVDRVESRWEKLFKKMDEEVQPYQTDKNKEWPRIEFMPIVFKGTYDEHNWNVLKDRWEELRCQLHGDIITERVDRDDEEGLKILKDISLAAPSFSPVKTG